MSQFLTYDVLAPAFLSLLRDRTVLPTFITRNSFAEANAHIGKKVSFARPRKRTAMRRDINSRTALTFRDSLEDEVSITLTDDVYDARPITDAEYTLDLRDFSVQVLSPMVDAIADDLEGRIGDLIEGATYIANNTLTYQQANDDAANKDAVKRVVLRAAAALDANAVPAGDRVIVGGSEFKTDFLRAATDIRMPDVNTTALRDASLGARYYGFDVFHSTAIAANTAYAFHRSAFMTALRAPVVPGGANGRGRSLNHEGIPITLFQDYDPTTTVDRIIARTFYGDAVNVDHIGAQDAVFAPQFVRAVKITALPVV